MVGKALKRTCRVGQSVSMSAKAKHASRWALPFLPIRVRLLRTTHLNGIVKHMGEGVEPYGTGRHDFRGRPTVARGPSHLEHVVGNDLGVCKTQSGSSSRFSQVRRSRAPRLSDARTFPNPRSSIAAFGSGLWVLCTCRRAYCSDKCLETSASLLTDSKFAPKRAPFAPRCPPCAPPVAPWPPTVDRRSSSTEFVRRRPSEDREMHGP